MSYTFNAPEPGTGYDVDFDFFDDPGGRDSPTNLGNSGKWAKNEKINDKDAHHNEGNTVNSKKDPVGKPPSSPPRSTAKSDDDSYSSDYSSDSSYTDSDSESDATRNSNVVKIEAKIPQAGTEKGDSDNEDASPRPKEKRSESPDDVKSRPKTRQNNSLRHDRKYNRRHSRSRSQSSDSYTSDSDSTSCSDSDVTDVSPLHSPHDARRSTRKEVTFRGTPNSSDKHSGSYPLFKGDRDDIDLKLLMQAVLEMDQKRNPKLVQPVQQKQNRQTFSLPHHNPTSANRKNFSFSNDSVRTIDKENQRLMQQIMNNNMKSKKKKLPKQKNVSVLPKRLSTSAINRNRDQLRIERENFDLLQRLHTVKPTKEVIRNTLIDEYDHHMLYGTSVAATHPPETKKKKVPTATLR